MEKKLRISLLGPLTATAASHPVSFRTDAERTLLAYLAAHQGTPQRRDTLAGLLSPDRPDKEALTYLRNRLTRLRKAIGDESADPPYLEIDRKQIGLSDGEHVAVDLVQFERLLTAVEHHPHRQLAGCPACLTRLEEAVALVRGELLAGLNFPSETWQAWLTNQREHVQTRALEAMTWLRDAKMVFGEWTAVLDIAQRQLTFEPWLEEAHRAAMLAHTTLGDRNAALAQYEQCQQILWDELGVEPEEETAELFEKIKADGEVSGVRHQVSGAPNNMPTQTTRFFGREREQSHLLERLVDPAYRLMTVVGAGGMGKTRLAVEVGQQVQNSFADGVWFIPLTAVQGEAEQIKIAVGEAVGLAQGDKQLSGDQVLAILREKQLLLILDNCESVLDALAFIPEWLRRAPHIAILATSREPLNFAAESVLVLGSLLMDTEETGAAEALFVERAQMARSDFALNADNVPHVRRICELVNGSPLGISLASAWVRRRSLDQIASEIGRSLDFLSTRLRDIDPRHRSMRAVFETSWQLLTSEEQAVLAALSVFPSSFGSEAATAVAQATLADLDALCEKSLLQQESENERYQLHSLVRQFAGEKLADGKTAVEQAFFNFYSQYAHTHQENYAQLQPEWANFSAAIRLAHAHQAWSTVLDIVRVLDEPWFRQLRLSDMREGLTLALDAARGPDDQAALAQTLLRLGEIELERNAYEQAEFHLADALILMLRLGNQLGVAEAKYLIGRIKNDQSQLDEALTLFEDAMQLFEEADERLGVAKNLNLIAVCVIKKYRDFQSALASLEQAVDLQSTLPPSPTYVETLRYLARTQLMLGAYSEGDALLQEALAVSRQLRDVGEYTAVLYEQLLLAKRQDNVEQALTIGYECLENFKNLGSLRWQGLIKTQLGLLHQTKQEYKKAEELLIDTVQIFADVSDIYEQAYSFYYLYNLYAQLGKEEERLNAKQNALRLNTSLNDPQLSEKLDQ